MTPMNIDRVRSFVKRNNWTLENVELSAEEREEIKAENEKHINNIDVSEKTNRSFIDNNKSAFKEFVKSWFCNDKVSTETAERMFLTFSA